MELQIERKESYSRIELLSRTFLGFIYILLPHAFILSFLTIWSAILNFMAFWIILFTGRYPESAYEFQVKLMRWNLRVNASIFNLVDGYPRFGLNADHEQIHFEVPYPENISRGNTLLKFVFGWFYILIPHGFALFFVGMIASFIHFISFWAILFTGKYPESMFDFMVGYLRWNQRVAIYINNMSDKYPPFSLN